MSAPDVVWVVVREDGVPVEVSEYARGAEKLAKHFTDSSGNHRQHTYTAVRYVRAET